MKKLVFILVALGFILACSSSDDESDTQQMPTEVGEYSLVLNGAGLTDHRVEMYNDTINFVGAGNLLAASDDFGNGFGVVIPQQSEPAVNIIETFPENPQNPSGYEVNTAVFVIGNNIYYSVDGVFELESFEVDFDQNCAVWTGNLNINFLLNGEGTDILNVNGTFEVFSEGCTTDN